MSGSFAIGNGEDGVYLQDGSNNTVGGTTAAARNVLSGNGWSGLTFFGTGSGNVAQGNYIGTNAAGTGPLGNLEQGVLIATPGPTTIGGTVPGAGNVIAYNGWDGVEVSAGTGHSVLGNSIYQNGDLGIDLGAVLSGDGSTPNDPGDGDTGTNNLQNFPVLTGAATNGTTVTIAGSLDSLSFFAPGYRVEFFANGASGQRYLGFTTVPIGAAGTATFSATLTAAVALGETVTATATGPDGSTSEFSAGVTATAGSTISGTIFHDVNGDANVTDDDGAVFASAIGAVRLHLDDGDGVIDSGDSFVSDRQHERCGRLQLHRARCGQLLRRGQLARALAPRTSGPSRPTPSPARRGPPPSRPRVARSTAGATSPRPTTPSGRSTRPST